MFFLLDRCSYYLAGVGYCHLLSGHDDWTPHSFEHPKRGSFLLTEDDVTGQVIIHHWDDDEEAWVTEDYTDA